jgi:nitrogen fixation NifU-like protein
MEELRDLYQEVILDHNKNPRNYHKMENATMVLDGQNPLCGDHYTLYLFLENDIIKDISFEGSGCAISKASASLMSSILKGKTRQEAEKLFKLFHKVVIGEIDPVEHLEDLGKLAAFGGVSEFPARVKCASLAWHTMHAALNEEGDPVSTK